MTDSWNLPRTDVAFEAAFEHSYNPMVITDADFYGGPFIRLCNPAFCAMTGYTEEELIGQSPRILQGPDTDRQVIGRLDRTIRAGEFFEGSTVNYRKDGGSYVVEWNISPVRDAGGDIVAYVSIQQNITVRHLAESEAEAARVTESHALLRASTDALLNPQVLLEAVKDPSGQVVEFLYREVNKATCDYLGMSRTELLGRGILELMPGLAAKLLPDYLRCLETGEPLVLDDFAYDNEILADTRRYDIRVTRATKTSLVLAWSDVTDRFHAAQRIAKSEEKYRLLAENSGDIIHHSRDGQIVWISPSVERILGAPAEYWIGRTLGTVVPADEEAAHAMRLKALAEGGSVKGRGRVVAADGVMHWFDGHARPYFDGQGHQDGFLSVLRLIDTEVAAEQAAEEARRQKERDDERYRRSIDNAAVGMCMVTLDGRLLEINEAGCRFFGYGAQELNGMRWQEVTAPEYLEEEQRSWDGILEGRIDSYRIVKNYQHADGHQVWGDLSVSGIRDEEGKLEHMIALITDVTGQVQADERNRILARQLQQETDRVTAELDSAAAYMASIMPHGLEGKVRVSSRYLPSQQLGGDCLDYYWLDDDHLLIKLIDVSGHGLEPALLAASVHNLMRSGSLALTTLLSPESVLTELNNLFAMDEQNDHYFTMWYGIYKASTRTLRYASAGSPPALAFNSTAEGTVAVTELFTPATPIGMFTDTEFTSRSYPVPLGCRLLIYSDGANEIDLEDGKQLSLQGFKELTTRLASSPNWSLDQLIEVLQTLGPSESFDDDCSLIQLTFD